MTIAICEAGHASLYEESDWLTLRRSSCAVSLSLSSFLIGIY